MSPFGDISSYQGVSNQDLQEFENRRTIRESKLKQHAFEHLKLQDVKRPGQRKYLQIDHELEAFSPANGTYELEKRSLAYLRYPRGDVSEGTKFDSSILNEEIAGFDQIGSHYTEDILTTMKALNASK